MFMNKKPNNQQQTANNQDTKVIKEYIRKTDKNGRCSKVGIMVATVNPNDPSQAIVGFSMCHTPLDKFDKEFGMSIAEKRAQKYAEEFTILPHKSEKSEYNPGVVVPYKIRPSLRKFVQRCNVYFKDKSLPVWTKHV